MRKAYWVSILIAGLMLSGCAGKEPEPPKEIITVRATETDEILACYASDKKFSRKEFNNAYKAAFADVTRSKDAEPSPLLCLSLHQLATYKQFKGGLEALVRYIKAQPESAPSLKGLVQLLQRLDQEKVGKWAQNNKNLDVKEEKEELEAENRGLLERIDALEKSSAQDQERINGLQQQIEQLKNIENIIKNRER
ncbi:MAG: hypothetical protein FWG62_05695 [Proteobacteria bacterium]|nr:hypothetical protein [Pseudomonadota bacterium]